VVAQGVAAAVLTPALIRETYGVSVEIGQLADGQRFIVTGGRG
jgi:ABC-type cobalamin/Fe3+-siderophores transport system ATPase subunit